jgi:hypothetical protein
VFVLHTACDHCHVLCSSTGRRLGGLLGVFLGHVRGMLQVRLITSSRSMQSLVPLGIFLGCVAMFTLSSLELVPAHAAVVGMSTHRLEHPPLTW